MKDKILKVLEECRNDGYDDLMFKTDIEYIANKIVESIKVIDLPCKVGDKVWIIYENKVEIAEIWRIVLTPTYKEFKWFIPCNEIQPKDTGSFKINEIGKTVFLTEVEAEKRLKEL